MFMNGWCDVTNALLLCQHSHAMLAMHIAFWEWETEVQLLNKMTENTSHVDISLVDDSPCLENIELECIGVFDL